MHLRLLLLQAMFCLTTTSPSAAHKPFVPPDVTPPDYVMTVRTFHEANIFKPEERATLIAHHGVWTRVGTSHHLGRGVLSVEDSRSAVAIRRGEHRLSSTNYEPRNTRRQQSHLGEVCTVWEIERSLLRADGPVSRSSLSCVTDDGIELWQRTVDAAGNIRSSREAIHLERRPIAESEVAPRYDLLVPRWDFDATTASDRLPPDYEARMEQPNDRSAVRIVRRHGLWQLDDRSIGARRRIVITYGRSILLHYQSDDAGAPREISIHPKPYQPTVTAAEIAKSFQPQALDKTEVILGESCRWFDMQPGISDVSKRACLTSDEIALKESFKSRSASANWTTVSLDRRPLEIDEFKPPAALLLPETWGIR